MGTNFYWLAKGKYKGDHIGKRSAAGLWCWDCDCALYSEPAEHIHSGLGYELLSCPMCGARIPEKVHNAGHVELGFANPLKQRPTGITGVASFSFAQPPLEVGVKLMRHYMNPIVIDEYGRKLTGKEFLEMLTANTPWRIQFYHSIGLDFS